MRAFAIVLATAGIAFAAFWLLTIPQRLPDNAIAAPTRGVAARGERIFWAGGCASCHAATGAKGPDRFRLGGGAPLKTPFGNFHAPNISPDPVNGIGAWSIVDFANAMQRGVDPDGRHLYPAFPYAAYQRMTKGDIADLFAFLKTLPPLATAAPENDLGFPYNIRRGIGLWKRAFMADAGSVITLPRGQPAAVNLGQYLVEGPGHCGECHTPRRFRGLGGLDTAHWLGGAPSLDGPGKVPNITAGKTGIANWSAGEIADYLETGFTPDYDSVGGSMVEVQANMAKLTPEDRASIAAYLKAIPPG